MNTEELLKLITETADEFQAIDLNVMHVAETCGFADYFVVMSGRSTTQTSSIAETGIRLLDRLICNREQGVPDHQQIIETDGMWNRGDTLRKQER